MFQTPILLIIFKRPDTTQAVFERIRAVKPRYLFVAADGARNEEEKIKCELTRRIIEQVDWECEIKTYFEDTNWGSGRMPARAISWFFAHVEQGIILEDDCVPDMSFFPYCENLLIEYAHDQRVSMISGTNLLGQWKPAEYDYYFSRMGSSWGWASWRRAWHFFDFELSEWKKPQAKKAVERVFGAIFPKTAYQSFFFQIYSGVYDRTVAHVEQKKAISWWDYQWSFAQMIHGFLVIFPHVNLVSNVGFGENATHTLQNDSLLSNLNACKINIPLAKNIFMTPENEYDAQFCIRLQGDPIYSSWKYFPQRLKRIFSKN
jgi:hypothetical protein